MDIKLKNHLIQGKEVKQPGDVIKIDKDKGEKLVKKGFAVEVTKDTAESNDESQTSETTETADIDKADNKTSKQKAKNKK